MTADNTSSEFALLTYAHHIVDMLANSTNQGIAYPSANNFNHFRLHPIYIIAGGTTWAMDLHYYALYGDYFSASLLNHSGQPFSCDFGRGTIASQSANAGGNGYSLRCVGGQKN